MAVLFLFKLAAPFDFRDAFNLESYSIPGKNKEIRLCRRRGEDERRLEIIILNSLWAYKVSWVFFPLVFAKERTSVHVCSEELSLLSKGTDSSHLSPFVNESKLLDSPTTHKLQSNELCCISKPALLNNSCLFIYFVCVFKCQISNYFKSFFIWNFVTVKSTLVFSTSVAKMQRGRRKKKQASMENQLYPEHLWSPYIFSPLKLWASYRNWKLRHYFAKCSN